MAGTRKKATVKAAPPHDYQIGRGDEGWFYVVRDAEGNELSRSESFSNRGFTVGQVRADYPGIRRS